MTIPTNHGAIITLNLVFLELAVAVELVVPVKRQAIATASVERERSVPAVNEEINAARIAIAVADLGKSAADVGGAVRPKMRRGMVSSIILRHLKMSKDQSVATSRGGAPGNLGDIAKSRHASTEKYGGADKGRSCQKGENAGGDGRELHVYVDPRLDMAQR